MIGGHIIHAIINPHLKFVLKVKTDDTTRAPRGRGEVYCSHNETCWGGQGRLPSWSKNGPRKQGWEAGLGFLQWLVGGAGVRIELPVGFLAQTWGRRGRRRDAA